jgi:hypothetical protein
MKKNAIMLWEELINFVAAAIAGIISFPISIRE